MIKLMFQPLLTVTVTAWDAFKSLFSSQVDNSVEINLVKNKIFNGKVFLHQLLQKCFILLF